jgi:hypothetical protein
MNLSLWLESAEIDWNIEVHQVGCSQAIAKYRGGPASAPDTDHGKPI